MQVIFDAFDTCRFCMDIFNISLVMIVLKYIQRNTLYLDNRSNDSHASDMELIDF